MRVENLRYQIRVRAHKLGIASETAVDIRDKIINTLEGENNIDDAIFLLGAYIDAAQTARESAKELSELLLELKFLQRMGTLGEKVFKDNHR